MGNIMDYQKSRTEASSVLSDSGSENAQTFEEKMDKQMRELEAGVGEQQQKIDEVPGVSLPSLAIRLVRFAKNVTGNLARFLKNPCVAFTTTSRRTSDKPVEEWARDAHDDSAALAQDK
jgi:type IV pilus biogenesis protein CpaD/CtpE